MGAAEWWFIHSSGNQFIYTKIPSQFRCSLYVSWLARSWLNNPRFFLGKGVLEMHMLAIDHLRHVLRLRTSSRCLKPEHEEETKQKVSGLKCSMCHYCSFRAAKITGVLYRVKDYTQHCKIYTTGITNSQCFLFDFTAQKVELPRKGQH